MNFPKLYDEYKKMETQELMEIIAGHEELGTKAAIARLVCEERKAEEQQKFNLSLLDKQTELSKKLTKYAIIGAIVAALVGATTSTLLRYVEKYLWQEKTQQTQKTTTEKTKPYQTNQERPQEPNTQTSSKIPSQNTPKGE